MRRRSTAVSVQPDDPRGELFSLGSLKNYIFVGTEVVPLFNVIV